MPFSPDIVPHPLQEFEAPAAEGAFALLDSPLPLQAFATAAVPWTEQDWLSVLGFQMAAEAAGGRSTKNTRSSPLGVNAGMGFRMGL